MSSYYFHNAPMCSHGNPLQFGCGSCVDKRLTKLEEEYKEKFDPQFLSNKNIFARLMELEKHKSHQIDENRAIFKRNEELEEKFNLLNNQVVGLRLQPPKRQPYKCPVCDFSGAIQLTSAEELSRYCKQRMQTEDGKWFIWCKSCTGKGIIWG